MKRNKRLLRYDLLDQMDTVGGQADVRDDREYQDEFPRHDGEYAWLIRIPFRKIDKTLTRDGVVILFAKAREAFAGTLYGSRCITAFSEPVAVTDSERVAEAYSEAGLVICPESVCENESVALVSAVNMDTSSPKNLLKLLKTLCENMGEEMTAGAMDNVCMEVDFLEAYLSGWAYPTRQNSVFLDRSFLHFMDSGGNECNNFYRSSLTCTYGIMYNIIQTFYHSEQLNMRNKMLSLFPNFNIAKTMTELCSIETLTSKTGLCALTKEVKADILGKRIRLLPKEDGEYAEFAMMQPMYRFGEQTSFAPSQWKKGKQAPGFSYTSELKDEAMEYYEDGDSGISDFTIRWKNVGKNIMLYAYIVPEAFETKNRNVIDCCVYIYMDVTANSHTYPEKKIEIFLDVLNEKVFMGQLDKESLLEILIEERLRFFQY